MDCGQILVHSFVPTEHHWVFVMVLVALNFVGNLLLFFENFTEMF